MLAAREGRDDASASETRDAAETARELLCAEGPAEVLARIVPEDRLGLRARIRTRLRERSLLLDAEEVLLRAQVLCALRASRWRGRPALDAWLGELVEETLSECRAEVEAHSALAASALVLFARPLALEPAALAARCGRFNRLAREQREAFFALVLDATAPERLERVSRAPLPELARRARAALEVFRAP